MSICGSMRKTYEQPHVENCVKKKCLHVDTRAPFYSIYIAYFSPTSTLFYLSSVSPHCPHSLHESTAEHHFDSMLKGLRLIFFSVTLSKGRSNHRCSAADARGWFHCETCGSGIFRTRTERSEGVFFGAQKRVFKLDMAFNYFCGSVIS